MFYGQYKRIKIPKVEDAGSDEVLGYSLLLCMFEKDHNKGPKAPLLGVPWWPSG